MENSGLSIIIIWLKEFIEGVAPRKEAVLFDGDEDSLLLLRANIDKGLTVLSPLEREQEGILSRRKGVVASISRRNVVFRWLSLPTQEPHELDGMVRFEAADALPFTGKEAVYDYCRLSGIDDGYSRVLLAGTSRGKLEEFLGRAGNQGIKPSRIIPSSFALQALALAIPGAQERSTILVDVTERRVETIALSQGDLFFARNASRRCR